MQKRKLFACIWIGVGSMLAIYAGYRGPVYSCTDVADSFQGKLPIQTTELPTQIPEISDIGTRSETEAAVPADVCRLTLADWYPEQDGVSAAARLCEYLTRREEQWLSQIYGLYTASPAQMADFCAGHPGSHGSAPGGWDHFTGMKVTFQNGNGNMIREFSNTRLITAICSVLKEDGCLNRWEEVQDFADRLWDASHSFSVVMGSPFYCDGTCTAAGPARPQEPETSASEELPAETEESAEEETQETSVPESKKEKSGPGRADLSKPKPEEFGPGAGESVDSESEPGVSDAESEADSQEETELPEEIEIPEESEVPKEAAIPESAQAAVEEETSEEEPIESIPEESASAAETGASKRAVCPGHLEFRLKAVVKGGERGGGLMELPLRDMLPEQSAETREVWPDDWKNRVLELTEQDWMQEYGLTVRSIKGADTLSEDEIRVYMNMVPNEAGAARRNFVYAALKSVGRIPYYWGGKPARPGYGGSGFGSITAQDLSGRALRGLDCSGWISWLYWTVTGQRLGADGTATQIHLGENLSMDQLLPGDICLRSGSEAHVVMFLGWSGDGRMICVQETSAFTDNVEVALTEPGQWTHLRRILPE